MLDDLYYVEHLDELAGFGDTIHVGDIITVKRKDALNDWIDDGGRQRVVYIMKYGRYYYVQSEPIDDPYFKGRVGQWQVAGEQNGEKWTRKFKVVKK